MRTSSIRLRANARLAILHEDYLEICDGNMLAAMLLSILIYWTDIKISKKDENFWVWKSHQDFQEDLMFDKPGMKPPHRTTIKTALDLLINKEYVQWRRNPKMPLDQTRQYLIDSKAIQKAIDALPPIVVKPTMQSQNNDNGMSNNQQSLSENQQCNDGIPTSNTNDYYTEITNPEITKDTYSLSSESDAPANVYHFEEEKKRITNGRIPAVSLHNVSHSQGLSEIDEDDDVPTVKMPAIPKQTPDAGVPLSLAVNPPVGDQDDAASGQAVPILGTGTTPAQRSGAGASPSPSVSTDAVQAAEKPKRPRAKKPLVMPEAPKGPPQMPGDDAEWNTRTCLQMFDYWRGAPLLDVGSIKYASSCAKNMAQAYNREQVTLVRTAMNNDKYWIERGGADICDVARHMQKELNKIKMPTLKQVVNGNMPPPEQDGPASCNGLVWWGGKWMTEEEADKTGFNGGFGWYK